jgi:hypothetical protein
MPKRPILLTDDVVPPLALVHYGLVPRRIVIAFEV